MFDMNPLNVADAQLQHWIMLFVAGTLGFIIGYVSRRETVRLLENRLDKTGRDVEECRQTTVLTSFQSGTEEDVVLNRIRARAGELNFDRIGIATAAEADDLKDIVGVGPFLERKLHAIGIYTFRQIARFNREDIDTVNDIIEFFPGRIERDNWVGQSAELAKRN